MPDWRIDTLDARGGLAFASCRGEDGAEGSSAGGEPHCIFVGAPDFRPEPVANRSIALAAGRGAFQTGLFLGGAEVPFPTATAVAEFVRRAYLRSGGGDGADGGGGEGPAPRPEGPPDLLRLEFGVEEARLRSAISDAIAKFQKLSSSLKLGEIKTFNDWPSAPDRYRPSASDRTDRKAEMAGVSDGPSMLASAALRLIYEMVKRLPSGKDPHALARWQRDAYRLGDLLAYLDLWPILRSAPHYRTLASLAEGLARTNYDLPILGIIKNHIPAEWQNDAILFVLFVNGPALDDDEADGFFYLEFERYDGAARARRTVDPIGDLSRIPLPQDFEKFIGSELRDGASLYHALTAFIGSPPNATDNSALIDVILFASACIVGPDGAQSLSSTGDWLPLGGRQNISKMRRAAVQELVDDAWNWLREHLPNIVFAPSVEKAIESAAGLRYVTTK